MDARVENYILMRHGIEVENLKPNSYMMSVEWECILNIIYDGVTATPPRDVEINVELLEEVNERNFEKFVVDVDEKFVKGKWEIHILSRYESFYKEKFNYFRLWYGGKFFVVNLHTRDTYLQMSSFGRVRNMVKEGEFVLNSLAW